MVAQLTAGANPAGQIHKRIERLRRRIVRARGPRARRRILSKLRRLIASTTGQSLDQLRMSRGAMRNRPAALAFAQLLIASLEQPPRLERGASHAAA